MIIDEIKPKKSALVGRRAKKNFIHFFLEQVAKNPHQVIVIAEDGNLTYDELHRKSDVLAKQLRKIGVKNSDLVGLCVSLNSDLIVCILGILKAGAAYFPLDPTYPKDRLQYMLKDGKPFVVLAESNFTHLFNSNKVLKIDRSLFINPCVPESDFEIPMIQSENLAYVLYTSGSTGKPKGIMVTHKSLPNIALAHNNYYPSKMRMLISGGVCFDASLLVIFHALINNEPLYLFKSTPTDDINKLIKFIGMNSISFMICVPSQYLRLLKKNHSLPFLKCVSLTGENLPQSLCILHAKLAPNALLYNEFGPTECAIGTTIAKIYDPRNKVLKQVTVGKPLPNTRVYILDKKLKEVPRGGKGEICISGIGLASGYMNNEALTHEKFVSVAICGRKSIRLYRTGDIGRFLPNGELEFYGRIDHRQQIGKNWINLGEVEYHISHCPEIRESAVLIKKDPKGKKYLVAYVTSAKKTAQTSVLQFLKNRLPKKMIPSKIIKIDKFPLSPNGKIDRDTLADLHE
jgi:amino acid adenylation domain-containing protein